MTPPDHTTGTGLSLPEAFAHACKMSGPLEVHVTHRATGAEQTVRIAQPFAVIGRAPGAGVRLDDPSVSQCHAYLQVVEGLPYCIDLGSRTGLAWEDGTQGRGWVHPGQMLRVGAFDVRVGRPAQDSEEAAVPHDPAEADYRGDLVPFPASLEVHNPGSAAPQYHPLDRPITLLGRHPTCNLRFLDDAIAYFHCAFINTSEGVWCVDVLSRKGTLLNGRTTRLARLREGDLIELGKVTLVVRTDAAPAGRPLVVNAPAAAPTDSDPAIMVQQRVAESVAGAFTPFREMLGQFQQCFVTMAQMFTTLQQEQASLVCEQMRQIQDLSRELRELRAEVRQGGGVQGLPAAPAVAATPATPPPAAPPPVTPVPAAPPAATPPPAPRQAEPKVSDAADVQALTDAHAWFLDRLAKMSQPPPPSNNKSG